MITKFQILELNKTYFWESNNALVEVRFSKAIIGTHDSEVIYYATLPNGETKTIKSKEDEPIKVYASPKDYINKKALTIPTVSLDSIANSLKLKVCYRELDGEKVAFHFPVWTIDNGIAKEHRIYAGTITATPNGIFSNNIYTINDDFPENYYTDRELMEKLHHTKVIAEDGTESVVGGELSSLLLNNEQKAILDEWLAVTKKLEEAKVLIISSESSEKYIAVNSTQIDRVYGYNDGDGKVISLDAEKATELQIPQLPLNVCNDYDSGDMWFLMKDNE